MESALAVVTGRSRALVASVPLALTLRALGLLLPRAGRFLFAVFCGRPVLTDVLADVSAQWLASFFCGLAEFPVERGGVLHEGLA